MKYIALASVFILAGCATIETTVTGPGGYKYKERITAIGGASIEKASQSLGGRLRVFNENGSPLIEVELDSVQEAEGVKSEMDAILAGLKLLGSLALPVP